jgi:hypothetical protein
MARATGAETGVAQLLGEAEAADVAELGSKGERENAPDAGPPSR